MKKILLAIMLGIALAVTPAVLADQSVTGTVTVVAVCGVPSTLSINYGNVNPGATSDVQTLQIQNTGNDVMDVSIYGTDWSYGTGTVGNTMFGTVNPPTTALTPSAQTLLTGLLGKQTQNTYFTETVPMGTHSGTYTQTMTLTASC